MAVRRIRVPALLLALVLALTGAVFGVIAPAAAAGNEISGRVVDTGGLAQVNVPVEVRDTSTNAVVATAVSGAGGLFTTTTDVADGDWVAIARPGGHWVDGWTLFDTDGGRDVGDLVVESDGVMLSGTVRDAGGGALQGILVVALGASPADDVPDWDGTDAAGYYEMAVPRNQTFTLLAQEVTTSVGYLPAFWDAPPLDSCGCGDEIVVSMTGATPAAPYDFVLQSFDDLIWLSVGGFTWDGDPDEGVDIVAEKWNGSSWDPADSATTDVSGIVDLFVYGSGDYRLTVFRAGVPVKITLAEEVTCGCGGGTPTTYPISIDKKVVSLSGLTVATPGNAPAYHEIDLTFAKPSSGGSGGGGGTSPGPRSVPRPPTGVTPTSISAPTPTPTATPEPTSTPSPSSSPSGTPNETPTPTPDPVPSSDAGFPWWIILLIVLALGILITVIVIVRRR